MRRSNQLSYEAKLMLGAGQLLLESASIPEWFLLDWMDLWIRVDDWNRVCGFRVCSDSSGQVLSVLTLTRPVAQSLLTLIGYFDFHMQVFKVRARKFNYQYLLYFTCKSYKTKHRHGVELPALYISAWLAITKPLSPLVNKWIDLMILSGVIWPSNIVDFPR